MIEVETTLCKQMCSIDNIPLSLVALEPEPHLVHNSCSVKCSVLLMELTGVYVFFGGQG